MYLSHPPRSNDNEDPDNLNLRLNLLPPRVRSRARARLRYFVCVCERVNELDGDFGTGWPRGGQRHTQDGISQILPKTRNGPVAES